MTIQASSAPAEQPARFSSLKTGIDRSKAIRRARLHSLLVRTLRIALPLIAVAIAGLYFVSLDLDYSANGVSVRVEAVRTLGKHLEMVRPEMTGITDQNGRFRITARKSRHDPTAPDLIRLFGIDARLTQPADRTPSRLTADQGLYNVKDKTLDLSGTIRAVTSNGLKAYLSSARLFLDAQKVVSKEPVRVDMLNGRVQAQQMVLWSKEKRVLFTGAVRVRIRKRPGSPGRSGRGDRSGERAQSPPMLRGRQ